MPLSFPLTTIRSTVRNVEGHVIAHAETVDAFSTMCWLHRDALIAKINAGLDEAADDKAALSQEQREQMKAQINSDMLATERREAACMGRRSEGRDPGLQADYDADGRDRRGAPQRTARSRHPARPETMPSRSCSPPEGGDEFVPMLWGCAACLLPALHERRGPVLREPARATPITRSRCRRMLRQFDGGGWGTMSYWRSSRRLLRVEESADF